MGTNPRSIANLTPWTSATAPRAGRPPGARNRLAKHFLRDLGKAWEADGKVALLRLVEQDPAQFVALVAVIAAGTGRESDATTPPVLKRIADSLERLTMLAEARAGKLPLSAAESAPPVPAPVDDANA